jgi:hypothetical protein
MQDLFNWDTGAWMGKCGHGAGDDLLLHTMQLAYVLSIAGLRLTRQLSGICKFASGETAKWRCYHAAIHMAHGSGGALCGLQPSSIQRLEIANQASRPATAQSMRVPQYPHHARMSPRRPISVERRPTSSV